MLSGLKFPFHFDVALLRQDLSAAREEDWTPHYNAGDYGGLWRGAALRSATGANTDLTSAAPSGSGFQPTPLLSRCPYFQQALAAFACPLKSARLLSLTPGSFIREHTDNALDYEDGEIRIHIPIQTNPGVEFYVSGERMLMEEGECYYVNVNLPHRVNNRGSAERIHLVIDAEVNEWIHSLFRRGTVESWDIPRYPPAPRGFDEFRELVLETPPLRERLRAITQPAPFAAAAVELGRELGYDLNEGDVHAGRRRALRTTSASLDGWLPVKAFLREGRPFAEWIYTGDRRFTEPFFTDSVRLALREPFTAFSRREMPLDAAATLAPVTPSGLIYHMSRCGSTLVAQMLAALPGALVMSEPTPLDEVIEARLDAPAIALDTQVQWLRWMVTALGQQTGAKSGYFIKLDAWHIHDLPLIRAAFPDVPWIFLHRNPAEVIASQARIPGMLGAPGAMDPRKLRLAPEDITKLLPDLWRHRVISGFLAAAESFRDDPNGMFVDYAALPGALWERVAPHFNVAVTHDDVSRLQEVSQYDSKNPQMVFRPAQ